MFIQPDGHPAIILERRATTTSLLAPRQTGRPRDDGGGSVNYVVTVIVRQSSRIKY